MIQPTMTSAQITELVNAAVEAANKSQFGIAGYIVMIGIVVVLGSFVLGFLRNWLNNIRTDLKEVFKLLREDTVKLIAAITSATDQSSVTEKALDELREQIKDLEKEAMKNTAKIDQCTRKPAGSN